VVVDKIFRPTYQRVTLTQRLHFQISCHIGWPSAIEWHHSNRTVFMRVNLPYVKTFSLHCTCGKLHSHALRLFISKLFPCGMFVSTHVIHKESGNIVQLELVFVRTDGIPVRSVRHISEAHKLGTSVFYSCNRRTHNTQCTRQYQFAASIFCHFRPYFMCMAKCYRTSNIKISMRSRNECVV
jgi:hypothetical protein